MGSSMDFAESKEESMPVFSRRKASAESYFLAGVSREEILCLHLSFMCLAP